MFTTRKQQYTFTVEDHGSGAPHGHGQRSIQSPSSSSSERHPSSSMAPVDPEIIPCVEARQLSFHYKSSGPLLTNINMTVPKGKIYALLGASGCGKTTLLRIILSQYKPLSGWIRVFGHRPGTPESEIPGVRIGYMPQDLALFHALTIEENLAYYGSLHGLSRDTIQANMDQLIEILNLPGKERIVSKLSGGQQRRVSFAIALVHQPPLLILDEPTVGVDPLLRQKIWLYLEESCLKRSTTVMLTTHYTEEAINAYRVGFIHSGTILAEDNPRKLMHRYQCPTLEDVFLQLCLAKTAGNPDPDSRAVIASSSSASGHGGSNSRSQPDMVDDDGKPHHQLRIRFSRVRFRTKLTNYYLHLKRGFSPIVLFIILPIFEAFLFGVFFVDHLDHIPVAVVNEDQSKSNYSLPKLFIEQIDQETLDLHYYNDLDEAIDAIHKNKARMAMRFPPNYSKYFRKRFLHPERTSEKVANNSNIELYADTSNAVFHLYAYQTILNAFDNYTQSVGQLFGYNPNFFGSPFHQHPPIYGQMAINYFSFSIPGMIMLSIRLKCFLWSSTLVIQARTEGYLEREFAAGITIEEYLLSFILLSFGPILFMCLQVIFIVFHLFGATCAGSLWHFFIVTFVSSIQGVCYGIIPSVVGRTTVEAMLLGMIIEMPLHLCCGIFWPVEGLPLWIRNILLCNPLTLPLMSAQNIMFRGWSLQRFEVLRGLLSSIGLNIVFLAFSSVYFRLVEH